MPMTVRCHFLCLPFLSVSYPALVSLKEKGQLAGRMGPWQCEDLCHTHTFTSPTEPWSELAVPLGPGPCGGGWTTKNPSELEIRS